MEHLTARVRVVLTAVVTWLVVASAVLVVVAEELTAAIGATHPVVTWILQAIVVLGVAISIITRVTPVLPAAHGLLAPPITTPVTPREAELVDQVDALRRAAGLDVVVDHDP